MSSAADRMRVRYRRQREGKCCLSIEVPTVELTESLIAAKIINTSDPTREELARGVEKLLALVGAYA
jgi:hypothetical protein